MININVVGPVIDKSQLQKTTANVIYKKHQAEINDIYGMMLENAETGKYYVMLYKKPIEEISWLLLYFRLKGFVVERIIRSYEFMITIKISW